MNSIMSKLIFLFLFLPIRNFAQEFTIMAVKNKNHIIGIEPDTMHYKNRTYVTLMYFLSGEDSLMQSINRKGQRTDYFLFLKENGVIIDYGRMKNGLKEGWWTENYFKCKTLYKKGQKIKRKDCRYCDF